MNADLNELPPRMMSDAHRMLGSATHAEDAVQDAFLRLRAAEAVYCRLPGGRCEVARID
jgi:DNA-directed RNA polymerase specialized sigma24 family protein